MAPLFRKKDKTTIAELEEYYANQNKRRSSTAWLMALLSIVITIAIIVALFLLGRWIYQTFIQGDDVVVVDTTETADEDSVNLPNFDSEELGSDRGVDFTESESNDPDDLIVDETADAAQNQTDVNREDEGTVSDEAASTDVPNTDRLANNNTSGEDSSVAGSTTDDSGNLPETGAGETVLAILLGVGTLGYFGARRYQLKK